MYKIDADGAVFSLNLTLVPCDTLVVEKRQALTSYLTNFNKILGRIIIAQLFPEWMARFQEKLQLVSFHKFLGQALF